MRLYQQILTVCFLASSTVGEPILCPTDSEVIGFDNINDLNEWMSTIWYFINSGGFYPPPYFFSLCPNTVFDDSFIFPVLNDTWILCGESGSSEDNCIVQTNETQVIILPHNYESEGAIAPVLEQVNFLGITFRKSTDVSIGAYGSSRSWAFFKDCHWEENFGRFSIHMLPPEQSEDTTTDKGAVTSAKASDEQAMFVQLVDCTFENNRHSHSTIVNNGGVLLTNNVEFKNNHNEWANILMYNDLWTHIENSLFQTTTNYFTIIAIQAHLHLTNVEFNANSNTETVVHVIDGSELVAENCFFRDNTNAIGPSMVDDESTLFYNGGNYGYSNSGFGCEGFLLLNEGEICDADGDCPAFCCEFGDISCDIQTSEPSTSPTNIPTNIPSVSLTPTIQEKVDIVIAEIEGKGTKSSVGVPTPRLTWTIALCAITSLFILQMGM